MPDTDCLPPILLSRADVGRLLGFKESWLKKRLAEDLALLSKKRQIQGPPWVTIGGCVYYKYVDLIEWVDRVAVELGAPTIYKGPHLDLEEAE